VAQHETCRTLLSVEPFFHGAVAGFAALAVADAKALRLGRTRRIARIGVAAQSEFGLIRTAVGQPQVLGHPHGTLFKQNPVGASIWIRESPGGIFAALAAPAVRWRCDRQWRHTMPPPAAERHLPARSPGAMQPQVWRGMPSRARPPRRGPPQPVSASARMDVPTSWFRPVLRSRTSAVRNLCLFLSGFPACPLSVVPTWRHFPSAASMKRRALENNRSKR
jgi:hypothetical protein